MAKREIIYSQFIDIENGNKVTNMLYKNYEELVTLSSKSASEKIIEKNLPNYFDYFENLYISLENDAKKDTKYSRFNSFSVCTNINLIPSVINIYPCPKIINYYNCQDYPDCGKIDDGFFIKLTNRILNVDITLEFDKDKAVIIDNDITIKVYKYDKDGIDHSTKIEQFVFTKKGYVYMNFLTKEYNAMVDDTIIEFDDFAKPSKNIFTKCPKSIKYITQYNSKCVDDFNLEYDEFGIVKSCIYNLEATPKELASYSEKIEDENVIFISSTFPLLLDIFDYNNIDIPFHYDCEIRLTYNTSTKKGSLIKEVYKKI